MWNEFQLKNMYKQDYDDDLFTKILTNLMKKKYKRKDFF